MRRPKEEIEAWGSATGMGDVAIEDSFTTGRSDVCCCKYYANAGEKISQGTGGGNLRDSGEEIAGIDVGGLMEDEVGGAVFEELAGAHYGEGVGGVREYRNAMGGQ